MKHYKFGYARVSTEQQNLARQLDMLTQYGVDYIFNEKMTGTKRDRPELNKLQYAIILPLYLKRNKNPRQTLNLTRILCFYEFI